MRNSGDLLCWRSNKWDVFSVCLVWVMLIEAVGRGVIDLMNVI